MNPAEILWVALLQARAEGDEETAADLESLLDNPAALEQLLKQLAGS
jgi:hypothetical protein